MQKQMRNPGFTLDFNCNRGILHAVLACCCMVLAACDTGSSNLSAVPNPDSVAESPIDSRRFDPEFTASIRQLTENYLQQIDADFDEVGNSLSALQASVVDFLSNPTASTMDNVRLAWLNSHGAYELTAMHRYFANRMLPDPQGLQLFQLQYQINQWPILPGYVDYVGDYADSGIVHDATVVLTLQGLREQHGVFEVTEATLGYHVIEFLLWGMNADEVTLRPESDYFATNALTSAQIDSGVTADQLPVNRRRQLLLLTTDALQADFQALLLLWNNNNDAVRDQLQAMNGPRLLSLLTDSMTDMLTEELLVRSLYLLLNGDYTDSIQSPFSHSTQNAVSAQLSSLERLLLETRTEEGVTLDALISPLSEDFADFFYQNFDSSKECLVLLYSTLEVPMGAADVASAEFEIVECINLVTNMIEHLTQVTI